MESVERYNIEAVDNGGDPSTEGHKSSDGAWVKYEDHAAALRAERAKLEKFAAFAGPDGQPKSVKWPAVAGVSDRDELWEKYIVRDDEDAHAVLSLIAFIDYRLQAAAEAAKEKNDA